MGFDMLGYGTRIIKVHCKSRSGKTNIRIIFLETQSPKGYLNIYTTIVLSRSSEEWKVLLEIIR